MRHTKRKTSKTRDEEKDAETEQEKIPAAEEKMKQKNRSNEK